MNSFGAMLVAFGCIQLVIQTVGKGRERWGRHRPAGATKTRAFWRDPVFWVPPAAFWVAGLLTIAIGSAVDV